MTDIYSKNERARVNATLDLVLLGQKAAWARADLASLEQKIAKTQSILGENLHINHLVEANQQLVIALLAAQEKNSKLGSANGADLNAEMREANENLVISALRAESLQVKAQSLQAVAEKGFEHQKSALVIVAHELRGPLTPISMLAERMVKAQSQDLPRMQGLIQDQVKHMARLIEDLLDVSRASTGKLRLDFTDVDIVELIETAISTCLPLMEKKGLHFNADLPYTPLVVHGDPVRLAQVLHNLFTNAAKYTQQGGHVGFSARAESNMLLISIVDDGIGISDKVLLTIFEPYVQDVHAVLFNGSGLGIGLTVVKELVEAHGGTVTVKSDGEGKGSEFTVMLQLVDGHDASYVP